MGKTPTMRRVCREFVSRHDAVVVEDINQRECQTLFSVANEILYQLTGKKGSYEGMDGVFAAIADYPDWGLLLWVCHRKDPDTSS